MSTKEEIITRMLSSIPDSYDKSEGSFIYDSVVGVAIALEDGYIEMETILKKAFVDSAFDDHLDRITSELGMTRKQALKANTSLTVTGTNGTVIPIGARFYVDDTYFVATESKTIVSGAVNILVECEQAGTVGNVPSGSIINFEFISGVTSVTNASAVTNGVDKESDEELRKRYYDKVRTPATSGNIYDYKNWCKEVDGVGDARIIPLWSGNGTVKCIIINGNKRATDSTLVDKVAQNIDIQKPIGATVTVVSATELPLNISVDIDIEDGYTLQDVTTNINNAITNQLKEIAFVKDYVSYALIGSVIFDVEGVTDYRNLLINDDSVNVIVTNEQVAVVGTIAIS